MFIKMLTLQAGPQGTREVGSVHEVSDKEGKALIEGSYALKVERQAPVARATGRRGQEKTVAAPDESTDEEG